MAIEICGGNKVKGTALIQGSKNTVLPMMAASILCEGETIIENCPAISDVYAMSEVLRKSGAVVTWKDKTIYIDTHMVKECELEEKAVREIRASVLFLGSMLSKFHRVSIGYPGGCSIGKRPIDFHLDAFGKMGAVTKENENTVTCEVTKRLHGTHIPLQFPSVGATENILLAAVCAEGVTWISNAAREPEIVEFCHFLCEMGAIIEGAGTEHIIVQGVERLQPVHWQLGTDRIAFLTYAMLVAGCGGEAYLMANPCVPHMETAILSKLGCVLKSGSDGVLITQSGRPKSISFLQTRPYPGFPTDGQSLLMAVLCKGNGVSTIEEGVFENRFQMVRYLKKMGANIDTAGNRAEITGVTRLHGARVQAEDLRSGAGLMIASAMADGVSVIEKEERIYRGYERIVPAMKTLGIDIRTV